MPLNDSTAHAHQLTIQDLLDLGRDPRRGALHRTLLGFDTVRLQALEVKLASALREMKDPAPELDDQYAQLALIRSYARRIVTDRRAKETLASLLTAAV